MIERIVSGFQTGADIGAIRAAKDLGVATGGWMTADFRDEGGARPEYAGLYGARSCGCNDYGTRTSMNVRDSEATLWFGYDNTPGYWKTLKATRKLGRPFMWAYNAGTGYVVPRWIVLDWLGSRRVINVAGNRESKNPGLERITYAYVRALVEAQKHE